MKRTRHAGSVIILLAVASTLSAVPSIDGTIAANEYDYSTDFDGGAFRVFWSIVDGDAYMAVSARTDGWVAIGFDPIVAFDNADMIFAAVDETGSVTTRDARSLGSYGPFPDDRRLGGSDDIEDAAGSESDGTTTVEFKRAVVTGDPNDYELRFEGGRKIVWATGRSDDFSRSYEQFGVGTLREDKR